MELRKQLLDIKGKYDNLANEYESLMAEHEDLQKKYDELRGEYMRLKQENESLQALLEKKTRPIKIEDAWKALFPAEPVPPEEYLAIAVEKLGLNGKIVVGQGYIFAEDEEAVNELLKTVYLSMIIASDMGKAEELTPTEEKVSETVKETSEEQEEEDELKKILSGINASGE
jgi:predicted nuclease with TOPRIM domain